ncbi:hypothetical protein E2542_SST25160 [Spatholobus suberectus]|nr:hypothetical protein E2542_SST25160 [Spatholobus suberectus]
MDPNKHECPSPKLGSVAALADLDAHRTRAASSRRTVTAAAHGGTSSSCPSSFPTPTWSPRQSHRSAHRSLHRKQHPHARLQTCTDQNRVELASASVRSHFLRRCADYLRFATHVGSHAFGLHNWNLKPLFLLSVDCCAPLVSKAF